MPEHKLNFTLDQYTKIYKTQIHRIAEKLKKSSTDYKQRVADWRGCVECETDVYFIAELIFLNLHMSGFNVETPTDEQFNTSLAKLTSELNG